MVAHFSDSSGYRRDFLVGINAQIGQEVSNIFQHVVVSGDRIMVIGGVPGGHRLPRYFFVSKPRHRVRVRLDPALGLSSAECRLPQKPARQRSEGRAGMQGMKFPQLGEFIIAITALGLAYPRRLSRWRPGCPKFLVLYGVT
jgi:hypothetical protein